MFVIPPSGPPVPIQRPSFSAAAPFADPFADLASVAMPMSVPAMLRHAEFFAVTNETLRAAFNRVSAYFVTDPEVTGDLGDDEKKAQKDYLVKQARVIPYTVEAGLALLVYGVQYTSVFKPFVRFLVCPRCHFEVRAAEFMDERYATVYRFHWSRGYHGRCPACRFEGCFADGDRPPTDVEDDNRPLILKSWNPHDIRIVYNESTGEARYFDWVLPADFISDVRLGYNRAVLAESPWEHIQAALDGKNIRLDTDLVHYWREPALPGLRFRGHGVPRAIVNYRRLYYLQILYRMNEALALGHVVPIRVISPGNTSGRGPGEELDILRTANLGNLRGQVMRIIANHRADPNSIQFAPVPLQMQALGADARQLIPFELIKQGLETILNGCDVPVDFFNMTLQTQAAPVGLRLMERMWAPFVDGQNRLLTFIGRRAQFLLGWETAEYQYATVRLVDAIELSQLRTQMAQAGLLSRTTALKTVDAEFDKEVRQKLEDMRVEQREQAEFERENDAFSFGQQLAQAQPPLVGGAPAGPGGPAGGGGDPAQQGGQPPAGMAGMPPGSDPLAGLVPQPGQKIDPAELVARAQAVARALAAIPDDATRYGKLQEIRKANEAFHGQVKAELEKVRSKARSQGAKLVLQQGGGVPSTNGTGQ